MLNELQQSSNSACFGLQNNLRSNYHLKLLEDPSQLSDSFLPSELSLFNQCYQCIYFVFTKHCAIVNQCQVATLSGSRASPLKHGPLNLQIILGFLFLCPSLFTWMPDCHQDSAWPSRNSCPCCLWYLVHYYCNSNLLSTKRQVYSQQIWCHRKGE